MHYLKLRYTQFTIKQKVEKKSLESNQVEPLTTNDEKSINTELDEDLEISKLFDQQFLVKLYWRKTIFELFKNSEIV